MKPESIPSDTVTGLRRALLDHYDQSARDLPWRRDNDPYRVLVSEFMLQQTRVETVIRYYEAWLERFPTVTDLAQAGEDQVLKAWEGLGYYRRARNLHQTAQIVSEQHGGVIPSDPEELRRLPGVGEYTMGAVASIAFGIPTPAVDGNVRRVFARLFDEANATPAWLRETAERFVTRDRAGDWTQALMELGATVCTPTSPRCDVCPVMAWCESNAAGTVDERPARPRKRAVPSRVVPLVVFCRSREVLVQRRPATGLLAGLWAFPESGEATPSESARKLGLKPVSDPYPLPAVEHRFTHLHVRYLPWVLQVQGDVSAAMVDDVRWVRPGRLEETALPVAQRKVFDSWLKRMTRGHGEDC